MSGLSFRGANVCLFLSLLISGIGAQIIEFINDGAWCWFQDERAIVDTAKGKLIIGSTNTQASCDVLIYDIKSKKADVSKRFGRLDYTDDHNAPALLVGPDGNYIAMWAHHYDKYNTRYSIYSGSGWSSEKRFDWNKIPGGTDYTIAYNNVYYLSEEKRIYNFVRANDRAPNFLYSDDNGNNWKFGGQLTTNKSNTYNKGYYKYWGNGIDRIDMAFTEQHPRDDTTSIYHGYIQGGKTYNSFGEVGDEDIYDREEIPSFSAFTKVFAHNTVVNGIRMGRCWQSDVARYDDGSVAILFKARAGNSETDHRNFYARFDGKEWKTTYIGKAGTKMYSDEQDYTGLGALCPDDPCRIYISSPFNPADDSSKAGKREIWRGITKDLGATWKWEAVTSNSSVDNFRPVVPKWKPGKEALLWFRGTYRTAQSFTTKIVGILSEYTPDIPVSAGKHQQKNAFSSAHPVTVTTAPHELRIHLTLSERTPVTAKVFSVSGNQIASLADNCFLSGSQKIIWGTRGVSAGIYFVHITSGKYHQTKRLNVQH